MPFARHFATPFARSFIEGGGVTPTDPNRYPNPTLIGGSNIVADVFATMPDSHVATIFGGNPCDATYLGPGNPAYTFVSTGNSRFSIACNVNTATNRGVTLPGGREYRFSATVQSIGEAAVETRLVNAASPTNGAVITDGPLIIPDGTPQLAHIDFKLDTLASAIQLRHGMGMFNAVATVGATQQTSNLKLEDIGPWPPLVTTTLDPDNKAAPMVLSEGNLLCVGNSNALRGVAFATRGVTEGKWYWEALSLTAVSAQGFGIGQVGTNMNSFLGNGPTDIGYFPSGAYWKNNANLGTGTAYTTGSILGFALDMAGNLSVYVDGVLSFALAHGLTGLTWPGVTDASTGAVCNMRMNFGSDSSFGARTTAQNNPDELGVGDFYYAPPAGFLALR